MNDIQIAQAAKLKPIIEIAKENGITEEALIAYGSSIAKVNPVKMRELPLKGKRSWSARLHRLQPARGRPLYPSAWRMACALWGKSLCWRCVNLPWVRFSG